METTRTEKWTLILALLGTVVSIGLGYYFFIAGLWIAFFISSLLHRWQMAAINNVNNENISPQKAFNRLYGRTLIKWGISLTLLVSALFVGIEFLIGIMVGLILRVLTYMGEAILINLRKGG
ncbi:MAG: hypothetical protein PWP31_1239 [Clostridia bacterium]|nr:hypothetical protein [Clostridia bacterium]